MARVSCEPCIGLLANSGTLGQLWRNAARVFKACGFAAGSYHPLQGFETTSAIRPVTFGYSRPILDAYFSREFYTLDAVPRAIIPTGKVMTWTEAWGSLTLSEDEARFWDDMRAAGSTDGLAIPCFGPKMRNGYVTLSGVDHGREYPEDERRWLQCLAQVAHLKLHELLYDRHEDVALSPRETEILRWVALGKSNSVIAQIVGCSSNTVDTHLRRIYGKMSVTDRTVAAIKGIGLGLIG